MGLYYKRSLSQLAIGISFLILCLLIYRALQSQTVYEDWLGSPFMNYRWKADTISPGLYRVPYPEIAKNQFIRWDGHHYYSIASGGYGHYPGQYAFFPLFPWIYRMVSSNPYAICILNWLMFVLAWLVLIRIFAPSLSVRNQTLLYAIGVALPSSVCFAMPYTEATYFVAAGVFLSGLYLRWPLLWVLGGILLGLSRPALLILIAALLCVEGFKFVLHLHTGRMIKNLLLTIAPLLTGAVIAVLVQMQSGAGPFSFLTVLGEYWGTGFSIPGKLGTWSHSGQMLELLGIFGIGSLAFVDIVIKVRRNIKFAFIDKTTTEDFSFGTIKFVELLTAVCLFGQALSILFLHQSNTHGALRYIYATPYFYIWAILKLQSVWKMDGKLRWMLLGYLGIATVIAWGLFTVDDFYGEPQLSMQLPFNGAPWMLLAIGITLFLPQLTKRLQLVLLVLLFLVSAFYCSFLFANFVGNGALWT